MGTHARRSVVSVILLCGLLLGACGATLLLTPLARAFATGTAIATSFPVRGAVEDGDLVSHNVETGFYERSSVPGDKDLFGVVVTDPTLLITDGEEDVPGMVPLVRFGEARVRVSTEGGSIRAGDYLTSSYVVGVAMKADTTKQGVVLGIALQDFPAPGVEEESVLVDGRTVRVGHLPVALRIGVYTPESEVATSTMGAGFTEDGAPVVPEGKSILDLLRYLIAAAVALGALFVALRNFGGSLSESIASVGRNPLAKTYILSMMFWNSMLIILICLVGFGIGAFIIMYPV